MDISLNVIAAAVLGGSRALGVLTIFPVFSLFSIDGLLRIFLAIGLSAPAVVTLYDHFGVQPMNVVMIGLLALKEFGLGYLLGAVLGCPFWAAQAAGDMTGVYSGSNQSNIFDQINALDTTPLGTILYAASLAIFVALGGLLDVVDLFLRSFAFWHILDVAPAVPVDGIKDLIASFSGLFPSGAVLAMPLVALLAAAELAIGFVGRSSRQFPLSDSVQIFKTIVLMLALVLYVNFMPTYFRDSWFTEVKGLIAFFEGGHGKE